MLEILRKITRLLLPRKKHYVSGVDTIVYGTANIFNGLNDKYSISMGSYCHIKGELLLFGHGGKIEMGDYCYVGPNTYLWSAERITIGNRVLISHNCNIFDSDTHPLDPEERHRQFREIITSGQPRQIDLKEKVVVIEDDVLIGANSIVLKGVTIGRGAIVGAGSVVTRDVPAFSIVAGNPARVVRHLAEKDADGC